MSSVRGSVPLNESMTIDAVEDYRQGFSYENLRTSVYRARGLQYNSPIDSQFSYRAFSLFYTPTVYYWLKQAGQSSLIQKGNKFHISLAHEADNVARGWNLVKDILIQHQVIFFKVIAYNWSFKSRRRVRRCGKEITIYAFRENRTTEEWQRILTEITEILSSNNVLPGPLAPRETSILGSNYISYRDDNFFIDRNDTPSLEDLQRDSDDENEIQGASVAPSDKKDSSLHSLLATHGSETKESENLLSLSDINSSDIHDELADMGDPVEEIEGLEELDEQEQPRVHPYDSISVNIAISQIDRPKFIKPPRHLLPANFFEDPLPIRPDVDLDDIVLNGSDSSNSTLVTQPLSRPLISAGGASELISLLGQSSNILVGSSLRSMPHSDLGSVQLTSGSVTNPEITLNSEASNRRHRFFDSGVPDSVNMNDNSFNSEPNQRAEDESPTCCPCTIF